jgi:hypothetical protein
MSKFKKRLRKAAKVGIGLAAAYSLMGGKKDAAKLISGKDSEVGAIAGMDKPIKKVEYITKKSKAPDKIIKNIADKAKIRSSRGAGDAVGGIQGSKLNFKSAADVRARNKAFNEKLKNVKGERYSILKSMGFKQGKMIRAKGGKEIVGKKTKLY